MSRLAQNRFEIVLRPLRDRGGAQTVVVIETRTAAQASREVTARYPDLKIVSVTRITPTVASLKAARRADAAVSDDAHPAVDEAVEGADDESIRQVG